MGNKLGPFQKIWDAWSHVAESVKRMPLDHFRFTLQTQLAEIEAHYHAGQQEKMANEMVDIISIALNWLRWLGYTPEDIADLVKERVSHRYFGQEQGILDKYELLRKGIAVE